MSPHDMRDLLRQAMGSREDQSLASSLSRASLRAGFAGDPAAEQVFRSWELGAGAALDLHLTGETVEGDATRADRFARFVARVSNAVKELSKDRSERRWHVPALQIAPQAPASVRVELRTPDYGRDDETMSSAESLDSTSLRTLTGLLLQADEDSEALESSVMLLRGPARRAVGLVGKAVAEGGWDVSGTLETATTDEPVRLHFDSAAAARLIEATSVEGSDTRSVIMSGTVDGWIWSQSVMLFDPDHGRGFPVAVPPGLQSRVGEINAAEDRHVVAEFLMTEVFPRGDQAAGRTSYALQDIDLAHHADEPLPEA